ncbi:RNA-directed DNA polymerase from mobile element jockey [Plakobranchus ocellatus]|uniref:RNA-directed DNA polymerase from mobile element jockey n=1 Tax=Plakobranchus ocellatus TaxID=259542 RepID=A0AAV4B6X9_9GAST|nr:RNA-directed DNA polymerase from mobile element jockey [Plakobranchus ocellatus]
MANCLIMPYAKNNQDSTPGSPMLGLSVGSTLLFKTYVWSVLLYGSECWTINKETEKKLEAVEMWFIRRMMRIAWTEKSPMNWYRKRRISNDH